MHTKFIFVTGGVVSGLGKGICAASLGRLLKERGLRVTMQKFDPYINADPGTMSPFQHGEVFVTEDGAETDLDLGHYERFIDENLGRASSVSSGLVYKDVIERERMGGYLGGTVQIIPHITNEIKSHICAMASDDVDVAIAEIGGTVGDIESQPFLEAIRQIGNERGHGSTLFIHVALIVEIPGTGEQKSKPVQHSVKVLLGTGIQPDILVCRSGEPIPDQMRRKIALFCNVEPACVIQNLTAPTLYEVPLYLHREGLDTLVCRKLGLCCREADLTTWRAMVERIKTASAPVTIAMVGKYMDLRDAYLSVFEALCHAAAANGARLAVKWVESEDVTDQNAGEILGDCDGVLVPGGFGDRGVEGMICAARYARTRGVPYFGICLGLQIAVIEFARDCAGLPAAQSAEFGAEAPDPVISLMEEQKRRLGKGGTMRLGAYPCVLKTGSKAAALYGAETVSERHRHRYELNNEYRARLERAGLAVTGQSPDGVLAEIIELPAHPWFLGVQFHPEFKSRHYRPHPIFGGFVKAALEERKKRENRQA